jgi:hypothetical protein
MNTEDILGKVEEKVIENGLIQISLISFMGKKIQIRQGRKTYQAETLEEALIKFMERED